MFEQSLVAHEVSGERSVVSLPVSIGVHAGAVVLAIFAAIWPVDFPARSPDQFEQFNISDPIPLPPAAPKRQVDPQTQAAPKQVVAQNQTPNVIPDTIVPAQPTTQPTNDLIQTTTDVGPVGDDGFDGPPSTGTGLGDEIGESPRVPGGDVKAPIVITRVEPPYPPLAIKMRWDGYVIIQSIIDRDGNIIDASVLRSTHPVFEKPALDSVVRWKFKPGTLYGKPVATIFTLTVTFKINS